MDAERLCRPEAVPVMPAQHVGDEDRFKVFHAHGLAARGGAHTSGKAEVLRQVMRLDQSGLAEDEGVLDDVLQFPDIAGVVVCHQTGQRLVGDSGDLLFLQMVEMANEMIDQ